MYAMEHHCSYLMMGHKRKEKGKEMNINICLPFPISIQKQGLTFKNTQ